MGRAIDGSVGPAVTFDRTQIDADEAGPDPILRARRPKASLGIGERQLSQIRRLHLESQSEVPVLIRRLEKLGEGRLRQSANGSRRLEFRGGRARTQMHGVQVGESGKTNFHSDLIEQALQSLKTVRSMLDSVQKRASKVLFFQPVRQSANRFREERKVLKPSLDIEVIEPEHRRVVRRCRKRDLHKASDAAKSTFDLGPEKETARARTDELIETEEIRRAIFEVSGVAISLGLLNQFRQIGSLFVREFGQSPHALSV